MPRRAWVQPAFGATMVAAVFAVTGGVGAADGAPPPAAALPAAALPVTALPVAAAPTAGPSDDALVQAGRDLFVTGCATCHGVDAKGRTLEGGVRAPSLYGVGEASADFQIRTGRMPLASPNAQAARKPPAYPDDEIDALVAYVGSLVGPGGPGPAIPKVDVSDPDLALGGELFRANCAACHNASGSGGALSQGRAAPTLWDATATELVEAMRTGPGQMPVFGPDTLSRSEADNIAAYALTLSDREGRGGFDLGAVGPVPEGFVAWVALTTVLFGAMRWITRRPKTAKAEHDRGER